MQCIRPSKIRNPAWTGLPDSPYTFMVPCGRCIGCKIAKTREWSIRCLHELDYYPSSTFVTLTYDDEHLPNDYGLHKDDLQRFFKRLRKSLDGRKIKYYACGEYGDHTYRPHYHAIIFGLDPSERYLLDKCWKNGFNTIGSVTYDSIKYVCGYIQKKLYGDDVYKGVQPPFSLVSSGIGYRYCVENSQILRKNLYVTIRGVRMSLPRYYRKILGIDTQEFFASTLEHREEVDRIFDDRVPSYIPDHVVTEDGYYYSPREQAKYLEREKSRIQSEKNMEAKLSLKERGKL